MSLLPHATLIIRNSGDHIIAVPVTNFPVLPPGSDVDIYFSEQTWIEMAIIERYGANSQHGTLVYVSISGRIELDDEHIDLVWGRVAKECMPDASNFATCYYPHPVDFGVKYGARDKH